MSGHAPDPVAFFGFDAAEPSLVQKGIDDGSLPTMARLVEEGRSALLEPVPSGFHNTSWIATVTGTDVYEHGSVLDRQLESGSYRIVDVRASSLGRLPFWQHLSDAGLDSTVVSIYSTAVVPGLRGTQVQGWGTIDPYSTKHGEMRFEPPDTEALLTRAVGSREQLYHTAPPRTAAEYRAYRDRILRSVDEQARGLAVLLEETRWDFFFGSFAETHHAGHLIWHLSDPAHPAYDPSLADDLRGAMMEIYRAVDRRIGELVERAGSRTRVFVFTPHGMRANYIHDPAEAVLRESGWLVPVGAGGGGDLGGRLLRGAWSVGRRVVPTRLRLAARSHLAGDGLLATMPLAHVDWAGSRAFALPSDMTSYVRVNLAGREPEGVVQPGEEYDRVCADLARLFGSLTSANSGASVVDRVVRCDEVLGHPAEGPLPDICVVWSDREQVRALRAPEIGTLELDFDDPRTGQHRHVGLIVGRGPGIPPSGQRTIGDYAGNLLDVAPTVLALLGVEPHPALMGRPLELFTGA